MPRDRRRAVAGCRGGKGRRGGVAERSIDPTSVYEICYETDCVGLRVSNLLSDDQSPPPSLEGKKKRYSLIPYNNNKVLHCIVLVEHSTNPRCFFHF